MDAASPGRAPLALKPDLAEADRRWRAFFAGDLIDRPVVTVTAPLEGAAPVPPTTYHDRVHGDIDELIDRELRRAEATFYGGEAVPAMNVSFGTDEVTVFCGGRDFRWNPDSGDTNWAVPFVDDWDDHPPLQLDEDNPLWRRMLRFCRRAAERLAGKMLVQHLDLHTNMDLLMSARGSQRLCLDLIDRPGTIDRAMADARAVFPRIWRAVAAAARMDERGYAHGVYSMEGAAFLQCDFSCMISPAMFRRWVLPALEEEAAVVRHAVYHWDGPGALCHLADLCAAEGLHCLSYVPGAGRGGHAAHLDLLEQVQSRGKAVHAWGSIEEVKLMHRRLRPEKVWYATHARSADEARRLLDWLVRNT